MEGKQAEQFSLLQVKGCEGVSAAKSGEGRQLARQRALYYAANGGQSAAINNAIVAEARYGRLE